MASSRVSLAMRRHGNWDASASIPLSTSIQLGRSCCPASYCCWARRSCSVMPSRFRSIFERSEIRAAAGRVGVINVVLAVFNMFPIPPLDGGRIAVGVLPDALAARFARLEPYGMLILIGLLFILPMLGAQLGADLNIVSQVIASSTDVVIRTILRLTGNT